VEEATEMHGDDRCRRSSKRSTNFVAYHVIVKNDFRKESSHIIIV